MAKSLLLHARDVPALPSHTFNQSMSLLFDFENEASSVAQQDVILEHRRLEQVSNAISSCCTPLGFFELKLLQDVKAYKQAVIYEEGTADIVVLAAKLAQVGYNVRVRRALGGREDCFRNLRHEFLVIQGKDGAAGDEFFVELNFKDQFQIPHCPTFYQSILNLCPEEFVGHRCKLEYLVAVISRQMEEAFEAVGLTCPPWRRQASMLSKWLPKPHKKQDQLVSGGSAGGSSGSSPDSQYSPTAAAHKPPMPAGMSPSKSLLTSSLSSHQLTAQCGTLQTFRSASDGASPHKVSMGFKVHLG